jgi:hypothetical protein
VAWTAPFTAIAGGAVGAAQFNTYVRDNLNTTEAALATSPGGHFVVSAANTVVQRLGSQQYVTTLETTTSTTYTDLTTPGPIVTVATGTRALVVMDGRIGATTTATASARMSYAVSGATTVAADDDHAIGKIGCSTDLFYIGSGAILHQGLTAGSNTFTAKYRVSSGTGSFDDRRMTVIPF